jgi:hypothetical protein
MTEQRIDLTMLARVDAEQKTTASRVDDVDKSLRNLAREVSEIKGAMKPPAASPWWLTHVVAPLCVTAVVVTAGAVIHLEIVVAGMGKNVATVQSAIAKQTITTASTLPESEFKTVLPDLASAIGVTRQQRVKVSPKVISDLQQHLTATDADTTPSFWPAASEFISYKSFNSASWAIPSSLPTCTDSYPAPSTVTILSPTKATINPSVYENCRFTIDSPTEDEQLNEIIQKRLAVIIFKHCVIVYRGGPINLIINLDKHNVPWQQGTPENYTESTVDVSVRNAVQFEDCIFDFVLRGAPPAPGRKLTEFLLANTDRTISFPLAAPS